MLFLFMKINEKMIFASILVIYIAILILRPFELDESLHILTGKMILNRTLDPFSSHYLNPFRYTFGSPLVPIIYGFFYLIGGFVLTRIVSLFFVFSTLILTYDLSKMLFNKKIANISLILACVSKTTILLATESLLDSVGVFFFFSALYLLYKKKPFYSGLFLGLAVLSKFIVIIPVVALILYLYKKGFRPIKVLIGLSILIVPFFIYDIEVLTTLYHFFISTHLPADVLMHLTYFLKEFSFTVPIPFLLYLIYHKKSFIKDNYLLIIPFLSIFFFHIVTLNYVSIHHSMPYGLVPLSVLSGKIISSMTKRRQLLFLAIAVILNLIVVFDYVTVMPSYSSIIDDIRKLDGIILAYNPNIIHLIKGTDLNDEYIYNFFYFDFNSDGKSTKDDYEEAMKNNFFDYIIIPPKYIIEPQYSELLDLVPKYYCEYKTSTGLRSRMTIYSECISR